MRLSNFTSWFFLKYNRNLLLSSGRPMFWINLDSNTLGSAALTPQEETKIKKIEDATEAARNKLWNHHIYGLSLKFLKFFWFFTPNLVSKRCYVESKHSGLNKLCLLVFPEILERAEKFGFWRQVSKGQDYTIQLFWAKLCHLIFWTFIHFYT